MTNTLEPDDDFVAFAQTPRWVLRDGTITTDAKALYGILATYADNETRVAFPSRKTLAESMGKSVSTVDRTIKELLKVGGLKSSGQRWRNRAGEISPVRTSEHRIPTSTAYKLGWVKPKGVSSPVTTPSTHPRTDGTVTGDDLTKPIDLDSGELVKSGCDCITHAPQNGIHSDRLGGPPLLKGKTKGAQEKAVNDYIGTPPSCFTRQERKAWYAHEAQWAYPNGADTYEKARRDIAWLWGVPVDSGMWEVIGWDEQVTQAQKAHSGLTEDGFPDQVEPQSQTAVRWALARLMADRMNTPEGWGFMGWDTYIDDMEYREAAWPDVRQPGTAA